MDVGSKIGQKMRLAIKVKLREMGCYVDDELPDYVMVMVANKRTRAQMEEDLLLFLGDNTESFVNWLHQVLKKLQEVTVSTSINDKEKSKGEKSSSKEKNKEKKLKTKIKKVKHKKLDSKKSKKKDKQHRKKSDKKKKEGNIRANIPPLLMNMEAEPSITDVFAGQILKNHGIILDKIQEQSPKPAEDKKPLIDPASINIEEPTVAEDKNGKSPPKEEELKNIEAKIQGLRTKLVEQLDMSEDEDFLNIRTEAEELMTDFADDVLQELTSKEKCQTPPPDKSMSPKPVSRSHTPQTSPSTPPTPKLPQELPQIELRLPKRPQRRLESSASKSAECSQKNSPERPKSTERFTPERAPVEKCRGSVHSRLGETVPLRRTHRKSSSDDSTDKYESVSRKIASRLSLENRRPASVVRVNPRPRPTSGFNSNLLIRAVADAQKSILTLPAKLTAEQTKVKQALVLPIPRVEPQIVIRVPVTSPPRQTSDFEIEFDASDLDCELDKDNSNDTEYVPVPVARKVTKVEYIPTRVKEADERKERERLEQKKNDCDGNIKDNDYTMKSDPQFVVTLDGLDPNIFLAKKLESEGLIKEGEKLKSRKTKRIEPVIRKPKEKPKEPIKIPEPVEKPPTDMDDDVLEVIDLEIIPTEDIKEQCVSSEDLSKETAKTEVKTAIIAKPPEVRKRKASPIVFDVDKKKKKKEKAVERERTTSTSSESHVVLSNNAAVNKYDAVPTLVQPSKKAVPCNAFPACRFGNACAFQHPPCRYSSSCIRRNCPYEHPFVATAVASHVIPSASYKTITSAPIPNICKYFPNCVNPACHFYHPKPCRYGKGCLNKLECNFYHHELVSNAIHKWSKCT